MMIRRLTDAMKSGGKWPAVRVSQTVFYAMIALTVVMFGAFYLIGYENPYDDNPDFNAPLLTGAVVWFMLLLLAAAIVTVVAAATVSTRKHSHAARNANGINARRLTASVTVLVVLALVLTFALAPTSAVYVNGSPYHDTLWLRATEMFVDTSLLLLIATLAAVVYGYCRHRINRRRG